MLLKRLYNKEIAKKFNSNKRKIIPIKEMTKKTRKNFNININ